MIQKRIGEYLVEKGFLTPAEVQKILDYSQKSGLRFGDAGLDSGLLTEDKLKRAFGPNYNKADFFHLAPDFFPKSTQTVFPVETLLRFGLLPLGIKTVRRFFYSQKRLNIGMLNPGRKDLKEVLRQLPQVANPSIPFQITKVFLILPDPFIKVIEEVYSYPVRKAEDALVHQWDETLQAFLEI